MLTYINMYKIDFNVFNTFTNMYLFLINIYISLYIYILYSSDVCVYIRYEII